MPRLQLSEVHDRIFDVVVIGAGINGCAAARELIARGFTVLVVEQGDFASGATSRSDRLLSAGLEFLNPERSPFSVIAQPRVFMRELQSAKACMIGRSQVVKSHSERVRPINFCIPIYEDGPVAWWKLRMAFFALRTIGPKDVPLDVKLLSPSEAHQQPILNWLRNPGKLKGVVVYREYLADWPERIALDTLFHAQRGGAGIRNYTQVTGIERREDGIWTVQLADRCGANQNAEQTEGASTATVQARLIVNATGPWIDKLNRLVKPDAEPTLLPTKATYIAVQLARDCRDWGVSLRNRNGQPLLCVPWRGLHFFGPVLSTYLDDLDEVRATDDEISGLLEEANRALPGLDIRREKIRHTWAGVWPLAINPLDPAQTNLQPAVEELSKQGLPNVISVRGVPLVLNGWAAEQVVEEVRKRVAPSREKPEMRVPPGQTEQRKGRHISDGLVSVSVGTLRHVAEHEGAVTLADLFFRRTGLGWDAQMGHGLAEPGAEAVADLMGWTPEEVAAKVREFQQHLKRMHHVAGTTEGPIT